MDLFVLDEFFNVIGLLYSYTSLIWTDRYNEYGDFEIGMKASEEMVSLLRIGRHLIYKESEHVMIIEKIQIKCDPENGDDFTVSGRSLESILDRRIVISRADILLEPDEVYITQLKSDKVLKPPYNGDTFVYYKTGKLQAVVRDIFENNCMGKELADRNFTFPRYDYIYGDDPDPFEFINSTDSVITSTDIEVTCNGDNLYDTIVDICKKYKIGFKITLNNKKMQFRLYRGTDRSLDQSTNALVNLGVKNESVLNAEYVSSSENIKNNALVRGDSLTETIIPGIPGTTEKMVQHAFVSWAMEKEGADWETALQKEGGLNLKEVLVEANDVKASREYTSGGETQEYEIGSTEYIPMLTQKGVTELIQYSAENAGTSFQAELNQNGAYKFGTDFFMGDYVECTPGYGISEKMRIVEFIYSMDGEGFHQYPTFEWVNRLEIETEE